MTGTAVVRRDTGEEITTGEVFDMATYIADLAAPAHLVRQQRLAAAYDAACTSLIGPNDVQIDGKDKDGNPRKFKKKSAWRKLARHFNISTSVLAVDRGTVGEYFIATVTVRASAPWGQYADALGACCTDEATGRRTITVADAIATAETRATNRATSNLIAMGEVTAEEIGDRPAAAAPKAATATATVVGSTSDAPSCPKCQGGMWDNRVGKTNPRAPDFKCKDRGCDGVIWPPKDAAPAAAPTRTDSGPLVQEPDFEHAPFPDEPPF